MLIEQREHAIILRIARGTLVPAVIDNREQGARADAAALGRNIVQPRVRHEVEQRRRRDEMTFVQQVRRKRSPEIELPGANLNSPRDRCTPFGGLGQQSWILVDCYPLLIGFKPRGEVANVGAGASTEVERAD